MSKVRTCILYGTPEGLKRFNQMKRTGLDYQYELISELEVLIYGAAYEGAMWFVCKKTASGEEVSWMDWND